MYIEALENTVQFKGQILSSLHEFFLQVHTKDFLSCRQSKIRSLLLEMRKRISTCHQISFEDYDWRLVYFLPFSKCVHSQNLSADLHHILVGTNDFILPSRQHW